jgi:hypothetical protein
MKCEGHHLRRFARATPAEPVSVVLRFCAEALVADRCCAVAVASAMLLRYGGR